MIKEIKKAIHRDGPTQELLQGAIDYANSQYLDYFLDNCAMEGLNFIEYIREERNIHTLLEDDTLDGIIKKAVEVMEELPSLLKDTQAIALAVKELEEARGTLSKQVAAVAAYDDMLKIYGYILLRSMEVSDHGPLRKQKDEELAGELIQFIFQYEDNQTIIERVKQIYAKLPVRMSRIKFEAWVEEALVGLKGVSKADFDNYMTYLEETYHPEHVEGYGETMPKIYMGLRAYDDLLSDIIDHQLPAKLVEQTLALSEALEEAVSLYTYTASMINNLLAILYVADESSMLANQSSFGRFEGILNEIFRSNADEVMNPALVGYFNEISYDFDEKRTASSSLDQWVEELKTSYTNQLVEAGLAEDIDRLAKLYILKSNSYFAPLTQKVQDFEVMDEKTLIDRKDRLLSKFQAVSSEESRLLKRARIANLMGVLNVIHQTPEAMHNHIITSLSGCKDEKEKAGSVKALYDYMSEEI